MSSVIEEIIPRFWLTKCNEALWFCWNRFLHKNPEDSNEVPGGFLSDVNRVS